MIRLTFDLKDSATPELKRILAAATDLSGGIGAVMGRAMAATLKTHYQDRNRTPNKLGGKRTNFWSQVAATVNQPVLSKDAVSVQISDARLPQKVFGGRIVPTKANNLAIPVHAAAHGKSPRAFDKLAFIPKRGGPDITTGFLVDGESRTITRGKNKGKSTIRPLEGGRLLYVLRGWVDQDPDPAALPTEAELLGAAADAALDFLNTP